MSLTPPTTTDPYILANNITLEFTHDPLTNTFVLDSFEPSTATNNLTLPMSFSEGSLEWICTGPGTASVRFTCGAGTTVTHVADSDLAITCPQTNRFDIVYEARSVQNCEMTTSAASGSGPKVILLPTPKSGKPNDNDEDEVEF